MEGIEQGSWSASIIADFDDHKYAPLQHIVATILTCCHRTLVNRVEWNVTGTVLASTGNDGKVRVWKSSLGGVWRPAGFVSVEAADQDADAEMDGDE
jgi:nucleoporin SEH1